MKKLLFTIVLGVILTSCSLEPQWKKTTSGHYVYGEFENNVGIIWEGDTLGPFVNGVSDIVIIDRKGKELSRKQTKATMGVVSGFIFLNTDLGFYLGEEDDDLPNGMGCLINNDTVYIGNFEDGILYEGNVEIYNITKSNEVLPYYKGQHMDGLKNGNGKLFLDGKLIYSGLFEDGKQNGNGIEYKNDTIVYKGAFKKGYRDGMGIEYREGLKIYEGEWEKGKRDGDGKEYNKKGLIVYVGEWEKGYYDGKGKLYRNGECIEGKWEHGRLVNSISSSSFFSDVMSATKKIFSGNDTIQDKNIIEQKDMWYDGYVDDQEDLNEPSSEQEEILSSNTEIIEKINSDIEDFLSDKLNEKVSDRFGFLNLLRMYVQPWFYSDISRANSAQEYFLEDISAKDVQQLINSKVDYYNRIYPNAKLKFVDLNEIPEGALVDTDVALKIFEREAIETSDVFIGIIADILICFVVAFIIGFIIGAFIPPLLPYVGLVDIIMGIVALCFGIYVSVFYVSDISIALEESICQMLVENYMTYLDSQNYLLQLFGL